ncbi:hydrophobic/amphiphilic exporter-1, HAE1 family [Faunimonas pinastri]|uniref:Hydrophobic/amphiphilic exporter-1, HAE1 family n=1 Tax=Faunimonas pinastri TaxID=1855383 RepID=A0A1H9A2L2_9HYPH|nr:efflux RND transporter permease subunit [Faunimonas pinastri]SEP70248.1 hydrophobic/amphiphilic exporter-1, HAE1 family [Faunimonas pinastri]
MNGISSWSIRHPVPTIVLFLVLTIAGAVSFLRLRTNSMPDIDLPVVVVTVTQPGAAPSELETQVTRIVEDALAGLGNVDHISSTVSDGASTTSIQFTLGTNIDRATNDVRNAVSSVESSLPAAANQPIIQRVEATDVAILTYVVEAPGMRPDELSWFVDNDIAKAMLSVGDVSKITREGGVDRAIRVKLDPDRLMALGVTAAEVSQTLAKVNVNQPGGRATLGTGEQSIRTLGSVATVKGLADTRIALSNGNSVRLSDLGQVEDTWEEPRQRARFNGKEVVAVSVFRSVGSSEVDVTRNVRARVQRFMQEHPDVRLDEVTTSTDFVLAGYDAALESLWIGALLAVIVVWMFLRDIRATIVSAIALPLSLIPTFAVMYAVDESLNTMTLLALSLVVGILVDDAIVEIENIVRHMRESGKRAYQAAIEAADEIGLAVVATTSTIIAVFLPVAFMPGIPGKIFRSFALAACVSVFFSLLVARTLTPLVGAYFMKAHDAGGGEAGEHAPRWMGPYLRLLQLALRWRWITLALGIGFFVGSMMLAGLLPSEFMPATDRGRSVLSVKLAPGSTLGETDRAVLQITDILRRHPEVTGVYAVEGSQSQTGFGRISAAAEVRTATVTANLVNKSQRSLSQQQFEAMVSRELQAVPGAQIAFGADGQSGSKVSVSLTGDDQAALARATDKLVAQMRGIPGLINPLSTSSLARPELHVTPKKDIAAELGISAQTIAATVDIATLGDAETNLPKFNLEDRQIPILVSLKDDARNDLARIGNLQVHGTTATVPLSAVADLSFGSGPNEIDRLDRRRKFSVDAQLGSLTLGQATQRIHALPIMRNLPPGVEEVQQGDAEHMKELFTGFAMALGAGVLLMYSVLVLLFRGFVQPVTILTALPLSIGGALGFLLITGSSLSVAALIGVLMLMGIAAKNSILLVEYALVAQAERGVSRHEALIDAARKRARPIIMTTVAMGAGMLPMALGFGADAESRAPMAIAVIGGLLSSTVLSLVYVPIVYTFMDDLQRNLGRRLRHLLPRENRPGRNRNRENESGPGLPPQVPEAAE